MSILTLQKPKWNSVNCQLDKKQQKFEDKFDFFVEVSWLLQKIKKSKSIVILEVTEGHNSKNEEHIPKAIEFNTNDIESAPIWNLKEPKELQNIIESKGICWNSLVVIYGSNCIAVSRVVWTLLYAGVDSVKILNGGIISWKKSEQETTNEYQIPTSVHFGKNVPVNPHYNKTTAEMNNIVSEKLQLQQIVCVRTEKEFKGEVTGYNYVKYKGKIPNSIWGDSAKNWFNQDTKEFLQAKEIEQIWKDYGINNENLIFYCGTGWRSSIAFIYAKMLGFKNVSNYDGGWHE